jgi:hypothetical protein
MTTLSPSNVSALKALASFDGRTVAALTDATFQALLDPSVKQDPPPDQASAQVGLATLLALYIRQGATAEALQTVLRDAGVPAGSSDYIAGAYRQNADLLRAKCANIAAPYGRVVGCDWRLDYTVSNSESGGVLLPVFFVKLKLEGGTSIDFSCTEEEMTALVATLKDAASEAARISQ